MFLKKPDLIIKSKTFFWPLYKGYFWDLLGTKEKDFIEGMVQYIQIHSGSIC